MDWSIIIPVLLALIAIIPGIINYLRLRKRDKVEVKTIETSATESIVTAATSLVEPLTVRIKSLEQNNREMCEKQAIFEERIRVLEEANFVLCHGLGRLIYQLKSHGIDPVFVIPDGLCDKLLNGNDKN